MDPMTCDTAASSSADEVSVEALPLSNRTRSRLMDAGILSVAALRERSDNDLLALRGFGHTCLREVRSLLRTLARGRTAGPIQESDERFPSSLPESLLRSPIQNLSIPNRARRVFEREQIITVGDYISKGPEHLLALRSFGETTFGAVNRAIQASAAAASDPNADGPDGTHAAESAPWMRDVDALTDELDRELERVPVAILDLPRRARRACQELGLRTLRDLAHISSGDLLLRRNFGQATLRRIQVEVDRYRRHHETARPETFSEALAAVLGRLQDKERLLVELREGGRGEAQTLTQAGQVLEITESRACQIEHAAWAKLRRYAAPVMAPAADQAVAILMRAGAVAPAQVLRSDPYFADDLLSDEFLGRMIARLLPHRLTRLEDGRLAAVPAATLSIMATRLRRRLGPNSDSHELASLSLEIARGLDLGDQADALVRALSEVLFHREICADADGTLQVRTPTQGLGDDLRKILQASGRPMHFREISEHLSIAPYDRRDVSEEKVRLRLCRDPRFLLIRRGLYDLVERFSIDPALRQAIADDALALLRDSGRPTSVALIGARLREQRRFEELNEFVLAALLREDERFCHLGRGSFVPVESRATDVEHVSEILVDVLRSHGGSMTYAELRRRVQHRRQVSDGAISATLVGRDLFLRVERGCFDLAERYPFDEESRARIAERTRFLLRSGSAVSSLVDLTQALGPLVPQSVGPVMIGDVLRRHGGFQFLSGGFIALPDEARDRDLKARAERALRSEGEPLRPTTVARRLELGEAETSLLRLLLKDKQHFRSLPDGRVGPQPSRRIQSPGLVP